MSELSWAESLLHAIERKEKRQKASAAQQRERAYFRQYRAKKREREKLNLTKLEEIAERYTRTGTQHTKAKHADKDAKRSAAMRRAR